MKPPFRRPSLYLSLAAAALVAGWVLVGMSLHFCDETQGVMDGVLVWALLGIGLMGNVYAFVLAGMARAPRLVASVEAQRGRVIIHGRTKWLDENSGWDPVDPVDTATPQDASKSQAGRPEMVHFQTTGRPTLLAQGKPTTGQSARPSGPRSQTSQGQDEVKERKSREEIRHPA